MDSALINTIAVVVGGIAAYTYFHLGEAGVAAESKCEYTYPVSTDAMAWFGSAGIMYFGFKHDEPILTGIGSAIFILHTAQFATHRVLKRMGGN